MSVKKLKRVSRDLTSWFDPVMTQKMRAAVPPPADNSAFLVAAGSRSMRETAEPSEPAFLLDETFAIYMLEEDKIPEAIKAGTSLVELVRNTGRFHHQVRTDSQPTGYARTEVQDGTPEICGLFVSDLARAFESAMEWLLQFEKDHDDYVQTRPLVRVLVVPSYHVHAFWLFHERSGRSDVVVIDAPPEMKGLEGERLLSSEEFIKAFEDVLPKSGLRFDADLASDSEPFKSAY
jgi:hypothetical protein